VVALRIGTRFEQAVNGGAWRNSIDYLCLERGRVDRITSPFPGHFGMMGWVLFPDFGKYPQRAMP
jgi:hypothetical protein